MGEFEPRHDAECQDTPCACFASVLMSLVGCQQLQSNDLKIKSSDQKTTMIREPSIPLQKRQVILHGDNRTKSIEKTTHFLFSLPLGAGLSSTESAIIKIYAISCTVDFVLLALLSFLSSVISSLFTQTKGGPRAPRSLP